MKAAVAKEADERLDNGSIVHWSEQIGKKVPVTCGECKEKRPLSAKQVNQQKRLGVFTGYHTRCRLLKHNRDGAKSGIEYHPSGAIIFWDWKDRDPEDPTHRVSILCSNKDKCVTPGERSYINRTIIETYPNWSGRCSLCVERDGLPMRRTDPRVDVVLPTGSIIHWPERTSKHVPVTCEYNLGGRICGHKRRVTTYTARADGYTGFCKKHLADCDCV
jgi:hypothetical protein